MGERLNAGGALQGLVVGEADARIGAQEIVDGDRALEGWDLAAPDAGLEFGTGDARESRGA
jgi:hypothetical protein